LKVNFLAKKLCFKFPVYSFSVMIFKGKYVCRIHYLDSFQASEHATFGGSFPLLTSFSASRALNSILQPLVCFSSNELLGKTISGTCGNCRISLYL
jgi:hypothetical protein